MREFEISVNIIVQSIAQLKKLYKDDVWDIIIANCSSFVFLGGQDATTLDIVSKRLGKETIDIISKNRTKGKQTSTSENNAIHGRELLLPDELAKMSDSDCIVMVSGYNPFHSKKYKVEDHPNYMFTSLSSEANAFDVSTVKTLFLPKLTKEEKEKQQRELYT
jgi:type IV secretion system protein VirD4